MAKQLERGNRGATNANEEATSPKMKQREKTERKKQKQIKKYNQGKRGDMKITKNQEDGGQGNSTIRGGLMPGVKHKYCW